MAESRICSVPDCGKRSHSSAGYCYKHQYRFKNYGSPYGKRSSKRAHHDEHVLFLRCILKMPWPTACITWPFGTNKYGYGQTTHNGRRWLVHTLVCHLANGEKPSATHQAAHLCGNGHLACVNPAHLSWKTPKENQADRTIHGTSLPGGKSPLAKITEDDASFIKRMSGVRTQQSLANIFGISQSTVSLIQAGRLWKDIAP